MNWELFELISEYNDIIYDEDEEKIIYESHIVRLMCDDQSVGRRSV